MVKYLENHGVDFRYDTKVTNVIFDIDEKKKTAKKIECIHNGQEEKIDLTVNDLVFVTNGSCTERAMIGDQNTAPDLTIQNGEDIRHGEQIRNLQHSANLADGKFFSAYCAGTAKKRKNGKEN